MNGCSCNRLFRILESSSSVLSCSAMGPSEHAGASEQYRSSIFRRCGAGGGLGLASSSRLLQEPNSSRTCVVLFSVCSQPTHEATLAADCHSTSEPRALVSLVTVVKILNILVDHNKFTMSLK